MSEIFITSDTHFCHVPSFVWEPRGFSSVEEMNEAIVERWNNIVKPKDIVYHLGDTILSNNEKGIEYFNKLNGEIFVIWGNHDSDNRKNILAAECSNFRGGWYAYVIKHGKMSIYLSHYPTLTANYNADKHFSTNVLAFAGHTHKKEKFLDENNPFLYNVCLDAHNCYPVHIDEAISDCRKKFLSIKSEKSE